MQRTIRAHRQRRAQHVARLGGAGGESEDVGDGYRRRLLGVALAKADCLLDGEFVKGVERLFEAR
jgi:hypothetical protein